MSWIKRKKAPRKKTRRSLGVLKRKLDTEFASMVRLRDEGKNCISCAKAKGTQAGHFKRRELLATRWHPRNVHGQCSHCNCWLHGELFEYGMALDRLYGAGTAQSITDLSRTSWKPSREALEALLEAAKHGPEEYSEIWNFYGSEKICTALK